MRCVFSAEIAVIHEASLRSLHSCQIYTNCSVPGNCSCLFCRSDSSQYDPIVSCSGGKAASASFSMQPGLKYCTQRFGLSAFASDSPADIYIGASESSSSTLSVAVTAADIDAPPRSPISPSPEALFHPHGIQLWMFPAFILGPFVLIVATCSGMLFCSTRKPRSASYKTVAVETYVTPGNPNSGYADRRYVLRREFLQSKCRPASFGTPGPDYVSFGAAPVAQGHDLAPWSNCANFESDCNEIVEYRCSGWFLALNIFWALAICAWAAAFYAYATNRLPTNMGYVVLLVGGGAGYVGAFSLLLTALISWRSGTDPSGCGFCGARVISDDAAGHEELKHRKCNPRFVFCSTNPSKCCSLMLPLRVVWIGLLNVIVGFLGVLAVAASLLIVALAAGGGGGGNCGNCGGDCNCCGGSGSSSSEKDRAEPLTTQQAPKV